MGKVTDLVENAKKLRKKLASAAVDVKSAALDVKSAAIGIKNKIIYEDIVHLQKEKKAEPPLSETIGGQPSRMERVEYTVKLPRQKWQVQDIDYHKLEDPASVGEDLKREQQDILDALLRRPERATGPPLDESVRGFHTWSRQKGKDNHLRPFKPEPGQGSTPPKEGPETPKPIKLQRARSRVEPDEVDWAALIRQKPLSPDQQVEWDKFKYLGKRPVHFGERSEVKQKAETAGKTLEKAQRERGTASDPGPVKIN